MVRSPQDRTSASDLPTLLADPRIAYGFLAVVALVVRVGYVLVVNRTTLEWGDEFTYDQLATNLLTHGCFCFVPGVATVWRAPLYPAILAMLYATVGRSFLWVTILQALSGVTGSLLLAALGQLMTGSVRVGILAGLMFVVHPVVLFASGLLYTETFYFVILLAMTYLWFRWMKAQLPRWWMVALGGILLGLSLLMKPNLLYFPVLLAGWVWIAKRSARLTIQFTLITVVPMLAVIAPWAIRNYLEFGEIIPVSVNTGLNLAQGNYTGADGGALVVDQMPAFEGLSEPERDRAYQKLGADWIRAHPQEFIALIPLKLYKFFSPLETSNRGSMAVRLAVPLLVGAVLFYLLGVFGFIRTLRDWRLWLLMYLLVAYPVVIAMVFYGGTRYGMAVLPQFMLFAAIAIEALLARFWPNRGTSQHAVSNRATRN